MSPFRILFTLLFSIFLVLGFSQNSREKKRYEDLERILEDYSMEYPKIDKLIDISITGSVQEFALAFSKETKLNLTIDPRIEKKIVTNFSDTRPRDILLHLCKFYQLDLTFSGSIISLIPYETIDEIMPSKTVDIAYNSYNDKIELNLKSDTLDAVTKRISELTGKNVISSKVASGQIISGFVGSTNFEDALEQIAIRNDLSITKEDTGYYIFDQISAPTKEQKELKSSNRSSKKSKNKTEDKSSPENLTLTTTQDSTGQQLISLNAKNVSIEDIIKEASKETGSSYFLFSPPTDKVSLDLKNTSFDQLLSFILQGTKFNYRKSNGLYLIGEESLQALKETKVLQLQHRSVKEVIESIPADLSTAIEIKEFIQLNSLIISGDASSIIALSDFITAIDKPVPVVMIELLIIDVQKTREDRAGIEAGLANAPVQSGGTLFPAVDFTFSSGAINELLDLLAGNGIVNLGTVRPNFYATLQAVEDNGYAKVRSKPRLSTLNGIEANLSLGETRYYLQERTTLQGNQNPISLQDRVYQPVNADFSIKILPVISGDEYVTLEIDVNQSDFIGQVQSDAPPAQVNRTFTSNIRILNGEMIVLGGLESKGIEDSGTGVPFLSRIPIIKWLFSKRRRAKNKSKLLIFVKPTIIY